MIPISVDEDVNTDNSVRFKKQKEERIGSLDLSVIIPETMRYEVEGKR